MSSPILDTNRVFLQQAARQLVNRGPSVAERKKHVLWVTVVFMTVMHLGALAAPFTFTWPALWLCLGLHWLTGGVGITFAYHRLLTHKSFTVPKPLEYLVTWIATLACEGGPLNWVTAHRLHHTYSDKEPDPHSPLVDFFWAHMGWLFYDDKRTSQFEEQKKVASDLTSDQVHRFLQATHIVWPLLLAAGLYAWGGLPFLVWGFFVRVILVYHCTWLVNSAAHKWGYQTYKTGELSTNNWWVAMLTYGEGWHNNHHAFQYSAKHGMRWWEIDTTYWLVKLLAWMGLAKNIKIPTRQQLASTYAPGKNLS